MEYLTYWKSSLEGKEDPSGIACSVRGGLGGDGNRRSEAVST